MNDILVVGLAGRHGIDDLGALTSGRRVFVRQAEVLDDRDSPSTGIFATFDAVFELAEASNIAGLIASALIDEAQVQSVAYLTAGFAAIGDVVTDELRRQHAPLSVVPGLLDAAVLPAGPVQIVDALTVAAADAAEPFIGSLPTIDPTSAIVITNWFGQRVVERATRRLQRSFGSDWLPQPDRHGMVSAAAREATQATASLGALEYIVARLRRADGCPWDREQTQVSLLPALTEEAEELVLAVQHQDHSNTVEELGDVLVNLLMQAQIAHEAGHFRFSEAVTAATQKLVRRHPHVFGGLHAANADEVLAIWQRVKSEEKAGSAGVVEA